MTQNGRRLERLNRRRHIISYLIFCAGDVLKKVKLRISILTVLTLPRSPRNADFADIPQIAAGFSLMSGIAKIRRQRQSRSQ
jgi:hypothetical protein